MQEPWHRRSLPVHHVATSVALEVRMRGKDTVNLPLDNMQIISQKNQLVLSRVVDVLQ